MAPLETLTAFALASLAFAFMPGPALLYTAMQTLARGRRAGFMAALGIHVGCYVHVFAAVFGLSAIMAHVPSVYAAIKFAGALYLVWLGIGMLRAGAKDAGLPDVAAKSARRAFLDSVVVEILNPKVAIFFLAFLPQFVDPAGSVPVWAQFLILGLLVNVTFSTADVVTVLTASRVVETLRGRAGAARGFRLLGGGAMIALGARLALVRD